jgi:DNA-directed RNA polymerase III subunit RPC1
LILGIQIAAVLEEAWAPEYTYIGVIVDTEAINKLQVGFFHPMPGQKLIKFVLLQLELTLDDIKWAIVAAKKLKIKQEVSSHQANVVVLLH